jgi:shikimate 5-dehydrogenase
MTVLGAGGAATALCVQAALDGVKAISIFNRKDKFFANANRPSPRSVTTPTARSICSIWTIMTNCAPKSTAA